MINKKTVKSKKRILNDAMVPVVRMREGKYEPYLWPPHQNYVTVTN